MNDIIKYSIIVPVYNRPEEIKELLETITEQTYKKDFEVLIIEDGSTISSKEILSIIIRIIQDLVILVITECELQREIISLF